MRSKILLAAALILSMVTWLGCGSGSSNDQGVSFSLLGFYAPGDDFDPDDPEGLSGMTVGLSSAVESTGFVLARIGLQNNLSTQFISLRRALISYRVVGASDAAQPPSTSVALNGTLFPVVVSADGTPASSEDNENVTYSEIPIVTTDVLDFINFNRDSYGLPFTLEVTITGVGVTSAGDTIETFPQTLIVVFVSDTTINPTAPSDDSSGDAA
jgi:hypothetical protein